MSKPLSELLEAAASKPLTAVLPKVAAIGKLANGSSKVLMGISSNIMRDRLPVVDSRSSQVARGFDFEDGERLLAALPGINKRMRGAFKSILRAMGARVSPYESASSVDSYLKSRTKPEKQFKQPDGPLRNIVEMMDVYQSSLEVVADDAERLTSEIRRGASLADIADTLASMDSGILYLERVVAWMKGKDEFDVSDFQNSIERYG